MTRPDDGLYAALLQRGVSRRTFLRFSAAMTAALALPATYAPRIAAALENAPRIPVIWLHGQSCGGNSEAFYRSSQPTVAELLLDLLAVEYDERTMALAGADATQALADAMAAARHGYIVIVEGAVPTGDASAFCLVGGRPFKDVVREVCAGALGTIAVGACAFDGGIAAADGGATSAGSLSSVIPGDAPLVCLPGCPVNVANLAATLTYYLTRNAWPETDGRRRPYFAYSGLIHNQCERRAHFEFGEFVLSWGDEGAQKDWCLYKMGCKGPETFANCPTVQYADGASWPVRAGHGCIGCHMPDFWDAMTPAYRRLAEPFFPFPNISVDTVGQVMVGGITGVAAVHGTASWTRNRYRGRVARRRERLARATDGAAVAEVPVAVGATTAAVEVASGMAPEVATELPKPAAEVAPAADAAPAAPPKPAAEATPAAEPVAPAPPKPAAEAAPAAEPVAPAPPKPAAEATPAAEPVAPAPPKPAAEATPAAEPVAPAPPKPAAEAAPAAEPVAPAPPKPAAEAAPAAEPVAPSPPKPAAEAAPAAEPVAPAPPKPAAPEPGPPSHPTGTLRVTDRAPAEAEPAPAPDEVP